MIVPIQATPYIRILKRLVAGPGSLGLFVPTGNIVSEEQVVIRPAIYLQDNGKNNRFNCGAPKTKPRRLPQRFNDIHTPTIAYHIKMLSIRRNDFRWIYFKHQYRQFSTNLALAVPTI